MVFCVVWPDVQTLSDVSMCTFHTRQWRKCEEGHATLRQPGRLKRQHFPIWLLREMRGCLSGVCIIEPAQGVDGQQQQEGFAK